MKEHKVCGELKDICCQNCLYVFSEDGENYCRRNSPDVLEPEPWVSLDGWCGDGLWLVPDPDSGEIGWGELPISVEYLRG